MTSPDPATSVNQSFWGAKFGNAPVGAPPGAPDDAIVLCDGADPADFPWAHSLGGGKVGLGWSWDLRGALLPFIHDLFRWLRPTDAASGDPTKLWGMRDSVNRQHLLAEQNNYLLKALAQKAGIDISKMPGA
jgi:hypothetical protein